MVGSVSSFVSTCTTGAHLLFIDFGLTSISRIAPAIIRATVGVVAVSTRRYIDWLQALHRSVITNLFSPFEF